VATEIVRHTLVIATSMTLSIEDLDNGFIIVNTTSGPITVTLPTAVESDNGVNGKIKRWGPNTLTVQGGGGQTIDGASTAVFNVDKEVLEFAYIYKTSPAFNSWVLH